MLYNVDIITSKAQLTEYLSHEQTIYTLNHLLTLINVFSLAKLDLLYIPEITVYAKKGTY